MPGLWPVLEHGRDTQAASLHGIDHALWEALADLSDLDGRQGRQVDRLYEAAIGTDQDGHRIDRGLHAAQWLIRIAVPRVLGICGGGEAKQLAFHLNSNKVRTADDVRIAAWQIDRATALRPLAPASNPIDLCEATGVRGAVAMVSQIPVDTGDPESRALTGVRDLARAAGGFINYPFERSLRSRWVRRDLIASHLLMLSRATGTR